MAIVDTNNQTLFGTTNYNSEEEEKRQALLAARKAIMGAPNSLGPLLSARQRDYSNLPTTGYDAPEESRASELSIFNADGKIKPGIDVDAITPPAPLSTDEYAQNTALNKTVKIDPVVNEPGFLYNTLVDAPVKADQRATEFMSNLGDNISEGYDDLLGSAMRNLTPKDELGYTPEAFGKTFTDTFAITKPDGTKFYPDEVTSLAGATQAPSEASALGATQGVTPPAETPSEGAQGQGARDLLIGRQFNRGGPITIADMGSLIQAPQAVSQSAFGQAPGVNPFSIEAAGQVNPFSIEAAGQVNPIMQPQSLEVTPPALPEPTPTDITGTFEDPKSPQANSAQANFLARRAIGKPLSQQEIQDYNAFAASMGTTFDPITGYSREAFQTAQDAKLNPPMTGLRPIDSRTGEPLSQGAIDAITKAGYELPQASVPLPQAPQTFEAKTYNQEEARAALGGMTLNEYLNAPAGTEGVSGLRTDPQGRMIPGSNTVGGPTTRAEAFPDYEREVEKAQARLDAQPGFNEAISDRERRAARGDGISMADQTDMAKANARGATPRDIARGNQVADALGVDLRTGQPLQATGGLTEPELQRRREFAYKQEQDILAGETKAKETEGERSVNRAKAVGSLQALKADLDLIKETGEEVRTLTLKPRTEGLLAKALATVSPTSTAAQLERASGVLTGDAFIKGMQVIKAFGGGLGSVTEVEGLKVERAQGAIFENGMGDEERRQAVKDYIQVREDAYNRIREAFVKEYGETDAQTYLGTKNANATTEKAVPNDRNVASAADTLLSDPKYN